MTLLIISQPHENRSRKGCVFLIGINKFQLSLSVDCTTVWQSGSKEHLAHYVTKYTICNLDP